MKFLHFINAELHVEMIRVRKALRQQDHMLMESFLATHHYTCNDLYRRNLCRLYLRAEFLSEICNPVGDNITPGVWQGRRPHELTIATFYGQNKRVRSRNHGLYGEGTQAGAPKPRSPSSQQSFATVVNVPLRPWICEQH